MSTHRPISRRKGSTRLSIWTGTSSLLIALQLWLALSSTAFSAPQTQQALGQSYDLDRAGVSVVRLVAFYEADGETQEGTKARDSVVCTGLGTIVASWANSEAGGANTWVLTDSYLINKNQPAQCAVDSNHPDVSLQKVQIWTSALYSSSPDVSFTVSSEALETRCALCSDEVNVSPALLIGFRNQADEDSDSTAISQSQPGEPYIDVALLQVRGTPLILEDTAATLPSPILAVDQQQTIKNFRIPQHQSMPNLEPGTPLVDQNGNLTSIEVKPVNGNSMTTPIVVPAMVLQRNIPNFAENVKNNITHTRWNDGLNAFYGKNGTKEDHKAAEAAFQATHQANPRFKAASDFAQLAGAETPPTVAVGNGSAPDQASSGPAGISSDVLMLALIGLIVLIILIAVFTFLLRRSRNRKQQHQGFTAEELAEAERQSTILAQQMQAIEAQQTMVQPPLPPGGPQPASPAGQRNAVMTVPPVGELHCPNCNTPVPQDAKFCPACRMWLSPSESGLHLRVTPLQAQSAPPPPPPPAAIADQPTMVPPSAPAAGAPVNQVAFADQPTMPAPFRAATMAEQPTVEIAPRSQNVSSDSEKTQPYSRKDNGHRLGFVVGTRSDPGIKRQYKPNEDSLFAAQGMIQAPNPQPFGLFVVADGMGGHANGQDASRLAIQTIVHSVLPTLMKSGAASDEVYTHLLAGGIQSANEAVHQRNVEKGGDMGTTVTAALLVDGMAYVANVGDSRTYLYRESSGGLTKVTNDHSVVASLVEAGIIKPDDIYTHPKRSHIYRSLGEKAVVEVDSFLVPLQEGDKLLLCSDGLWDMVRDPQIGEVVKAPGEPPQTCDALIQAAYQGGGEDNVSVIVVEVKPGKKRNEPFKVLAKPDNLQMPALG